MGDLDDDTEVVKMGDSMYDFRYGMNAGCFGNSEFHEPPILGLLMLRALQNDFSHYSGALSSKSESAVGPWHRDTYDLFGNDTIDVKLPPYYYKVLIPLVTLTAATGATEIILGSHKLSSKELSLDRTGKHFEATCQPGSIVVFDGRCCHRQLPNRNGDSAPVLYMVWHKMWYNDYGTLEYNFPLGSWRTPTLRL